MEIIQKFFYQIFCGNHKAANNRSAAVDPVKSYTSTGCNIALREHFFFRLSLRFLTRKSLGSERFHQEISTMEQWYQGKQSPRTLADYCRTLRGEVPYAKYSRKSSTATVQVLYYSMYYKFYSHQLMHFFIQPCIRISSYIKIT